MKKLSVEQQRRMHDAAKRYAKADASDPFAYNRAMLHLKNGIASPATRDGSIAYYDAEEVEESRALYDTNGNPVPGSTYKVKVYRNAVRP